MKRNFTIIMCVLIAMMCILVGCSKEPDTPPTTEPIVNTIPNESIPVDTPIENPEPTDPPVICVTETNWDAPTHYLCAVEISGYDGVNLEPGVYHFYLEDLEGVELLPNVTHTTWEIYITKDVIYDIETLTPEDVSFAGRIGGEANEEAMLVLNKGYYVYAKCCDMDKAYVTDRLQIIQVGE